MIPDLPRIEGVPLELLTAINARLRLITALQPVGARAQKAGPAGAVPARTSASGTHAVRLATLTTAFALEAFYQESDRGVLYQLRALVTGRAWVYVSGEMRDTFANRPADLGANDAGFPFTATDTGWRYLWDGSAWGEIQPAASQMVISGFGEDTGLELDSATTTAKSRIFRAIDSGRADLAVNAYFDGVNWQRDDVTKPAHLVVMGDGASVDRITFLYAVPAANPISWVTAAWISAGVAVTPIPDVTFAQASALTLAATDKGYKIRVTTGSGGVDYYHRMYWDGTAWQFDDEPGYRFGEFPGAPIGRGWQKCDGSATTYLAVNSGTGALEERAFTTPSWNAGEYLKGGAAYDGAVTPAGSASVSGATQASSAAIGADDATNTFNIGAGGSITVAAHPHGHSDTGHAHALSAVPVTFSAEPISHATVLRYFRR